MSMVIGTVNFLVGKVVAISVSGEERVLKLGGAVLNDDVIRPAAGAEIEISLSNGDSVVVSAGESWSGVDALSPDVLAQMQTDASLVGTVNSVSGTVVAVATDGSERTLLPGDAIYADETIRTGPDSFAELVMNNGSPVVVENGQSWLAAGDGVTAESSDISALQQAILAGADPTSVAEATAAGAPGAGGGPASDGGGTDFVSLERTAGEVNPIAGYGTGTFPIGVETPEDEQPLITETPAPVVPVEEPEIPPLPNVTVKLFAVVDGDLVDANSVLEGSSATYIAKLVDADENPIEDATGTVVITFSNGSAILGQDYSSSTTTVALNEEFTATAIDDYIADNNENFFVSASNYSNEGAYGTVTYASTIETTIGDNTGEIPEEPATEQPQPADMVTFTLYAVVDGQLVDANSVQEGAPGTYVVMASALDPITGATVDVTDDATGNVTVQFGNIEPISDSDYQYSDSQTLSVPVGTEFTVGTIDDTAVDSGEQFNISLVGGYNGSQFEAEAYQGQVTTTILDTDQAMIIPDLMPEPVLPFNFSRVTGLASVDMVLGFQIVADGGEGDQVLSGSVALSTEENSGNRTFEWSFDDDSTTLTNGESYQVVFTTTEGQNAVLHNPEMFGFSLGHNLHPQPDDTGFWTETRSFVFETDSGADQQLFDLADMDTTYIGTEGSDVITSSSNADTLIGLGDNDNLQALGGDDTLYGGSGDDDLAGGAGRDIFVVNQGDTGSDTISDFELGIDRINVGDLLSGANEENLDSYMSVATSEGHLVLGFDPSGTGNLDSPAYVVTIENIAADLDGMSTVEMLNLLQGTTDPDIG